MKKKVDIISSSNYRASFSSSEFSKGARSCTYFCSNSVTMQLLYTRRKKGIIGPKSVL